MITGQSFRDAREASKRTQQEVADALGVSLRTIGNWERSGVVPRKYWNAIAGMLPASEVADLFSVATPLPRTAARTAYLDRIAENVYSALDEREKGLSAGDVAEKYADAYRGAVAALDLAESAMQLGVNPSIVVNLVRAATDVALESGTVSYTYTVPGFEPGRDIITRGTELLSVLASLTGMIKERDDSEPAVAGFSSDDQNSQADSATGTRAGNAD